MSSQSQIDANRRNAQLSTGPRSPEGKAKVAHNGRPHGLSSRNPVLPIENPAEFQALLDRLRATFQPANEAQEFSLREMAWADWRLRRVARIESGMYAYRLEKTRLLEDCPDTAPQPARTIRQQRYDQETRLLGIAFYRDCEDNAFVKLTRYENTLRRAYYKARNDLQFPPPPPPETPPTQTQFPPPPPPAEHASPPEAGRRAAAPTPRDPTPPPPVFNIEDTYAVASPEPPPPWPPGARALTADTPSASTLPARKRRRPTQEMPVDTRRAKAGEPRRTLRYVEGAGRAQRSRREHIVRRLRRKCGLEWEAYGKSRIGVGFLEDRPAGHRPGGRRHARRRVRFQARARAG